MEIKINEIIIPDDIDSLPDFDCFDSDECNELVKGLCGYVLSESSKEINKYRYGEVAISYNTDNGTQATINGTYHHIELNELLNPSARYFNDIIRNSSFNSVIIVHNHPNNQIFSFQDVRLFYGNDSISAILAVGNTTDIFILVNNNVDVMSRRRLYAHMVRMRAEIIKNNSGIKSYQVEDALNQEVMRLLSNPKELSDEYGFKLIHKNRKR